MALPALPYRPEFGAMAGHQCVGIAGCAHCVARQNYITAVSRLTDPIRAHAAQSARLAAIIRPRCRGERRERESILARTCRGTLSPFLERILQAPEGVLDFAVSFVLLAFSGQLRVAKHFTGGFLDGAFCLLDRTFNAIFVHVAISCKLLQLRANTTTGDLWPRTGRAGAFSRHYARRTKKTMRAMTSRVPIMPPIYI